MVGGQRDVAYADIDSGLRRATEDGEQIVEEVPEEEPARPVTVVVDEVESTGRPPGKLYGRSLVDELERRKATMRNKQRYVSQASFSSALPLIEFTRVFTGDDRPSMMARGPMPRPSTFIDPTSLSQRPAVSQNTLIGSEARPNLARSGSLGGKPLLNFDEDRSAGLQALPIGGKNKTRSVFGVDTLWQRETARLKELEAQEAEELRKQEAAEALRSQKKANKKKKGKEKVVAQDVPAEQPRVSAEAPTLPVIQRGITRGPPPPPNDDETESSNDSSDGDVPRPPPARVSADGWHSGESDNEKGGPVRTTGVGPRYPERGRRQHTANQSVSQPVDDDDDSEEDMPLAATVSRAVERATRFGLSAAEISDSDEEKPLSQLLVKSKHRAESSAPLDTDKSDYLSGSAAAPRHGVDKGNDGEGEDEDEDEDDKPLGLRVSRFVSQSQFGHADAEDDDDRPLALHPEQQRRTQYNMFLLQNQQQQQQQQQMLIQAQMQQSMMFSTPSLMGPGFFGGPVMPQMVPLVTSPIPASPPPGAPDMTKFGRVDRWRREIAGGQP
jgi:hypothetical protein